MEIDISERNYRVSVISPKGRLDAFTVPALRERITQLCDDGVIYFVLDLSAVSFMDSAGMTVLVSLLRRTRPNGGNVKLVRPTQDAAMRILRLTKMDQAFEFVDNVDAQLMVF